MRLSRLLVIKKDRLAIRTWLSLYAVNLILRVSAYGFVVYTGCRGGAPAGSQGRSPCWVKGEALPIKPEVYRRRQRTNKCSFSNLPFYLISSLQPFTQFKLANTTNAPIFTPGSRGGESPDGPCGAGYPFYTLPYVIGSLRDPDAGYKGRRAPSLSLYP